MTLVADDAFFTYVDPPAKCDLCAVPIASTKAPFIDGQTRMGPWANMCINCFPSHGLGLGTGTGQLYWYSKRYDTYIKMIPALKKT